MLTRLSNWNVIIPFDTLARYLLPISLIYLSIPYIVFFAGWLNTYKAIIPVIVVIVPLGYVIYQSRQRTSSADASDSYGVALSHLVLLFVLLTLIMMISGAGGVGYQDSDWKKHNALMKDLQLRQWPVVYVKDGVSLPLVYYIAYYMPAAMMGRIFGNVTAQIALFIWTFIGLFIAALWFIILVRRSPYLSIVMFFIFSGLDIIGVGIYRFLIGPLEDSLTYGSHIEFWAENWQYSSPVAMIFWVPQHAISGWMIGGILLYSILYRPKRDEYLYYASLSTFWSPFVTVGLLPFLVVDFFMASGSIVKRLKNYVSLINIFGLAIAAIIAFYFISKFFPIPLPLKQPEAGFIFSSPRAEGMVWQNILILMFSFIMLEFGIYTIMIALLSPLTDQKTRYLFYGSVLFLALLPFLRYGKNNDLVMRASIPAMFLLSVLLTQAIVRKNLSRLTQGVFIGVIAIGAVTPTMEIIRHITEGHDLEPILTPSLEKTKDIVALQTHYDTRSRLVQYVGSIDSPFFEFMMDIDNCRIPSGVNIQMAHPETLQIPLSDRFTLICAGHYFTGNQLEVDLFLQTRRPPYNQETHDTIYVHVTDENGERVAGSDVLLFKNYDDVSISSHKMELPADLQSGSYYIVVGIYYFENEQIINVGSTKINMPIIID